MTYRVTKALLDLYDRYEGDLGLLNEAWASKEDRSAFAPEQMTTLGEYVDQLNFSIVGALSPELRCRIEARLEELETLIDPEVVLILRGRTKPPSQ